MSEIKLLDFLSLLKVFTKKQAQLVKSYLENAAEHGEWPKHGTLKVSNEIWEFRKHGAGVWFKNRVSQEEIDAHKGMEDFPFAFDCWRLETYFSSLNKLLLEVNGTIYNLYEYTDIEKILYSLEERGAIEQIAGSQLYKLNN